MKDAEGVWSFQVCKTQELCRSYEVLARMMRYVKCLITTHFFLYKKVSCAMAYSKLS